MVFVLGEKGLRLRFFFFGGKIRAMKTQIVTTAEIKAILGITGTTNDAMLEIANDTMTEVLLDLLGLDNFDVTAYTDEEVNIYSCQYLELKNYPIALSPVPTLKDEWFTDFTAYPASWVLEKSDRPFIKGKDSSGGLFEWAHEKVLVSYTAGWQLQSEITVINYLTMGTKTFTVKVAGETTTYTEGTDFTAETSNDVTATNIATAVGGTAVGAIVTLPAGHYVVQGTMADAQMTIDQYNLPNAFRTALALLANGFLAGKEKGGGIVSYSLGGKSVSFGSTEDYKTFEGIMRAYLPSNKKFNCA